MHLSRRNVRLVALLAAFVGVLLVFGSIFTSARTTETFATSPEQNPQGVYNVLATIAPDAYFHCIARIDKAGTDLSGSTVCYQDSPDITALSDTPPELYDNPDQGPDGIAGAPPPPPYGLQPPAPLIGMYDPVGKTMDLMVCFQNLGGALLAPNVLWEMSVDTASGNGDLLIHANQTTAGCKAFTPNNAGLNVIKIPAAIVMTRQAIDFDHDDDTCTDYQELELPHPDLPKCGDDPYNPHDSGPKSDDLTGTYDVVTVLSPADWQKESLSDQGFVLDKQLVDQGFTFVHQVVDQGFALEKQLVNQGITLAGPIVTSAGTSIVFDVDVSGTKSLAADDEIMIDAEQFLVTNAAPPILDIQAVIAYRAQNGTTGATHSDGAAVWKKVAGLDDATSPVTFYIECTLYPDPDCDKNLAQGDEIVIDDEQLLVTSVAKDKPAEPLQRITANRAQKGTDPATHAVGATVWKKIGPMDVTTNPVTFDIECTAQPSCEKNLATDHQILIDEEQLTVTNVAKNPPAAPHHRITANRAQKGTDPATHAAGATVWKKIDPMDATTNPVTFDIECALWPDPDCDKNLAQGDEMLIDGEQFVVISVAKDPPAAPRHRITANRAQKGTDPATHAAGATVWKKIPGGVIPGAYFHCKTVIQHHTDTNDADARILCYIDNPLIPVNTHDPAGGTGDGIIGAPPPKPLAEVPEAATPEDHATQNGTVDKQANTIHLEGCFDDQEGDSQLGSVWVESLQNVHTGMGTVDIWTHQPQKCAGSPIPPEVPTYDNAPIYSARNSNDNLYDSDSDGCSDAEELGDNPQLGGLRDPYNPWDFFDPTGDGAISGLDFFKVLGRFGAIGEPEKPLPEPKPDPPAYHKNSDRGAGPVPGSNPWNTQEGDGAVSGLDFFGVLGSFGGTCLKNS